MVSGIHPGFPALLTRCVETSRARTERRNSVRVPTQPRPDATAGWVASEPIAWSVRWRKLDPQGAQRVVAPLSCLGNVKSFLQDVQ